ncbi:MAG: MmgE/PrpD family protein [Pseudomonadota bacterium]
MTAAVDAFVTHARETEWSTLTPKAQASIKTFLLDTIGVGVAGSVAPLTQPIRDVAGAGAHISGGAAHLLGGGSGRPADAAFVNGFQIHCQEFDCVHEPAVVHPMATILATLMATADARGDVSGGAFGAALSVAVDCAAGLGAAVKSPLKFFRPATAGIFGATLGACMLRRLGAEDMRNALGYALAFCSGTMQSHLEGKPALPVQIANAAANAVRASELAQLGVAGPHDVFEGPFGYLTLFEDKWDLAPVIANLGAIERITEVSHKPFPTGRAAQGGIVLMGKLREQGVTLETAKAITLTAPPLIERLVGRPIKSDMDANYARLCFQHIGGVALQSGTVGLDDFDEESLRDPAILGFGPRISVVSDGSGDPAAFTPQTVTANLTSGERVTARIDTLFGAPADPLTPAQNEAKFRTCIAARFEGDRGTGIADRLITEIAQLETLEDVRILSRIAAGIEKDPT